MDRIEIYQEIRSMKIIYFFHFIFYVILGIEHLLIMLKIFWDNKINIILFISCSTIDLILFFYPIIPLKLMYRIILKKNLAKIFKLISLISIIFTLVIGIIINIFFWLNLKTTENFFKECPYNLNDIKMFLTEENSSEKCAKRRCILESINNSGRGYPYNYICNYNSQNEFEIDPNVQYPVKLNDGTTNYLKYYIQCQAKSSIKELFTDNDNINNEIYIYLEKCWDNNDLNGFYLCQRYEFPIKFEVKEDYTCPKDKNYIVILFLFGIFLIVFDIFFALILWSLDYKSYSRILLFEHNDNESIELDNNEENGEQRRRHNETNTSSHNPHLNNAEGNNNQNDNNINGENNNNGGENNEMNGENDFNHQPTETIIIVKDRKTNNNSSNMKSSDRLNSGLNSNDMSKSSINNNKRKNKKTKENIIGSMISQSESQNMISKSSEKEKENESEDTLEKKKLVFNKENINNNIKEIDEIKFNNDIKYDEYKNNDDEDEKDIENTKSNNNCLIQNKNININNKNKKNIILLKKEDKININLKEAGNSIITTNGQKNNDDIYENDKNNKSDILENFGQFEDINENYRNKTPKKEIKSLNFNFSQVLTNIRDSDQISLFNNTNGSIIKEERKEETEKSIKEEEKNNNKSKNENKRQNLSVLTPFKMKKRSKDKENKEEKKFNTIVNIKSENQSSLLVENSNKTDNNSQIKEEKKIQNNIINA